MQRCPRVLNAEMNVTPFLDVLLVLIIIFMAAVAARKTLDAHLPLPCSVGCVQNGTPIVLEVVSDGVYRLNRKPVDPADLLSTLRRVYAERPDKVLQVAGHRAARYQSVLDAMDAARSAGVTVIAIPPSESYSSP